MLVEIRKIAKKLGPDQIRIIYVDRIGKILATQISNILLSVDFQYQSKQKIKKTDVKDIRKLILYGLDVTDYEQETLYFFSALYGWGKKDAWKKLQKSADDKLEDLINALSQSDQQAIAMLKDYGLQFLQTYYNELVGTDIYDLLLTFFEEGITQSELAARLEEALKGKITTKLATYFATIANHYTTKLIEFGRVASYELAEIEYVEIVAKMDDQTTDICRLMNGRLIPVNRCREQITQVINAGANINDLSQAQPMVNQELWNSKFSKLTDTKDLIDAGLRLPPYHFNCRTTTVAYFG